MDTSEDARDDLVRVGGTRDCQHPDLSFVGGDKGGNEYYRCRACEGVVIRKGSVSPRELQEGIEAETRDPEPHAFSDLLDTGAERPSPSMASETNPPGVSFTGALRERLVERLPSFGDEERDR